MGMLLHWSFEASFADGSLRVQETAQRGLRPLLAVLEYWPEMRVAVSLSGAVLDSIEKKTLDPLGKLLESGKAEVLLAPYAVPAPRWRAADSLAMELDAAAEIWAKLGVSRFAGVFLPEGVSVENAAWLAASSYPLVLTPERTDRAPGMYGDAGSRILIVSKRQAAGLADGGAADKRYPLREADGSAVTFSVRAGAVFPDQLSAVQQRSLLLDLFKDLRGDGAAATRLSDRFAAENPPAGPFEPAMLAGGGEDRITPGLSWTAARLDHLAGEVAPLPERIKTMTKEIQNRERLKIAQKALLAARSADLWDPDQTHPIDARRAIVAQILKAQVEADTLNKPDTDPMIGWVEHALADIDGDGTKEVISDTQLLRLYVRPAAAGAVVELDYKPRKFDLVGVSPSENRGGSFLEALVAVPSGALTPERVETIDAAFSPVSADSAEALVTKHSKDLFGLRLIRSSAGVRWVKHFSVKAGIGAHLSNSTTGLSFEYWFEADRLPGPEMSAVSRMVFNLPSGTDAGASLRPLSSVGGEAEKVYPLSEPLVLQHSDVPGGLYGGRLIDGIENFVMDLRSAKPLSALACFPLKTNPGPGIKSEIGGVVVLFFIDPKRVYQDDKANTIFLSIR